MSHPVTDQTEARAPEQQRHTPQHAAPEYRSEEPAPQGQDQDHHRHQGPSEEHDTMDTGQVPGTAAMSAQFAERPSDHEIAEIEAERQRRLQHRPENSEVDNTHRTFNAEIGRFEDCEDPIHFQKHGRH